MFVLGTAGHVDHGKSTLVEALTGIDPDRLPEEKNRGMTIVLGFAWLPLSDGNEVALVDVPGHERFVKTMIAGAGGIDAVLFIIDVNEGWMPQTEEHLRILDFLGVDKGIVVLTKVDAVDDEWLSLVEEDIAARLAGTFLADAPRMKVSAHTGLGMPELRAAIESLIKDLPRPVDAGKPRLPIDRVFSIAGMGTVVTGTLMDGTLETGAEVELVPSGKKVRVRGIQSHKKTVSRARPGTRVALNLAGIEKDDVERGQVATLPGHGTTTRRIEAEITMLGAGSRKPFRSGTHLIFHAGTQSATAAVLLLGATQLSPGETSLAHITLKEPFLLRRGDRFILRAPYPNVTVGGGMVTDPFPLPFRKKDEAKSASFAEAYQAADLPGLVLLELEKEPCLLLRDLLMATPWPFDRISGEVARLQGQGKVKVVKPYILFAPYLAMQKDRLVAMVKDEHKKAPLDEGISSAHMASRMSLPPEVFEDVLAVLVNEKKLVRSGAIVRSADFKPVLSVNQQEASEKIMALFEANPFAPPARSELVAQHPANADVIRYLKDRKMLVELSDGILFRPQDFETIRQKIAEFLKAHGPATVSQIREMLGTSRKYVLPVLGRLDEEVFTKRDGDYRSLR